MRLLENRKRLQQLGGGIRTHRSTLAKESSALLLLLSALLAILIALSIALPTHTDTPVDAQQTDVRLDRVQATEYQGTLPLRRLQADSSIRFRAGGPAEFDIRLFLRGDDSLREGYSLPLLINGVAVAPLTITAGLHEYQLRYRLAPAAWNPDGGNTVQIALLAPQGTPTRPLPFALTRVSIQPASVSASLHPGLLLADALIFAVLYVALRLAFKRRFRSVLGGLGIALLILGGLALVFPAQIAYGAQQFGLHPKRTAILAVLLPIAAVALPRGIAYVHRRWQRRALPRQETASTTLHTHANSRIPARDLTLVFTVALGFRLIWALLVPPWQAPDEGAHFSYVAHIVESAELPTLGPYTHSYPAYSVEFQKSWDNTLYGQISTVGLPRIPNLPFLPPSYDYEIPRDYQAPPEQRRNSAGGSATPYPPLYYLVIALPYKLFQSEPLISRLFVSRIVSSLFSALSCIFAYLMAYEIRRERAWGVAIGLCMALMPMYTFVSSSINNDTAVICLTTALIWLMVYALRRESVNPHIFWTMGIVSGIIAWTKPTGMVVVGLVASALFIQQWPILRRPWQICWLRVRALARFTLPFVALYALLIILRLFLNSAATSSSSIAGTSFTLPPKYSFWSYLQTEYNAGGAYFFWFFIKTFWGIFGWIEVPLPEWSYSTLLIFCTLGVIGCCVGLVISKSDRRWLLLLLALVGGQIAFLFVVVDYLLSFARSGVGLGLQGRYLFPVLAPIFFLLVAGWYSLSGGRKLVLYLAPFAILLLQILSLATIITRYYGVTFGW
jgi:hypothetical protein